MRTYKLVNKVPVRCDVDDYMSDDDRVIAKDIFGESTVSTVFLTWDHSFNNSDKPVLFETMVFGGEYNDYQERYETYEEAIEGHKQICYMVNKVAIDRDVKLNDLGI